MEFKLSNEIIDQIIFAMENQEEDFIFDTETCAIVAEEEADLEDSDLRYEPLPPWSSLDGFKLMESFVSTLRNPIYRDKLQTALSSGKGVFRNFKNVLKERPDIERLWYSFKERELKKLVVEWYESICEARGYQKMLPEKDDTGDLVLSDFVIAEGTEKYLGLMENLVAKSIDENLKGFPSAIAEELKREHTTMNRQGAPFAVYAETPGGDFAGFILAREDVLESKDPLGIHLRLSKIVQIYVLEEYRGLGIADVLFSRYLSGASARGVATVMIDISGQALSCVDSLSSKGFVPLAQSLFLSLPLEDEEHS